MPKAIDKSVRVGLGVALAVVLGIAATSCWVTYQLGVVQQWLTHGQAVGTALDSILYQLTLAESARQSYELQGDPDYLELYRSALLAIPPKVARLRALTSQVPEQEKSFLDFENLTNRKLALLQQGMTAGQGKSRTSQSLAPGPSPDGLIEHRLVSLVDQMDANEQALLRDRQALSHKRYLYAIGSLTLQTTCSVLLLLGVFYQLGREQSRRWKTEAALTASEQHLSTLVESVRDYAIFMLDRTGRVASWNIGAQRIYGYSPDEILGQSFSCLYTDPGHAGDKAATVLRIAEAEGRFEEEGWRVRKDGTVLRANVVVTALRDPAGHVRGFVKITQDVSERRKAEEDLRHREHLLDAFFGASPLGLAILDTHYRCQKVNKTLGALAGQSAETCVGRLIDDVLPAFASQLKACLHQVATTGVQVTDHELSGRDPNTSERAGYWLTSFFPITTPDGGIAQIGLILLDISKRKRAEDALRQTGETLRRLSGQLIKVQDEERRRLARELHDGIGQCLAALKINLEILAGAADRPDSDSREQRALRESLALTEQCLNDTRTISHLLHPPLLDRVGLASALRWYISGFTQRSGIKVQLNMSPDPPRLPSDLETTLFRIVQEGLTNVHRHSGSPTAEIELLADAEQVTLELRDRGRGFPAPIRHRPDDSPVALGVGIAGMQERVHQFGGQLEVKSTEHGTTVKVALPLGGDA